MLSKKKWFLFLLFGCAFVFILSMPMYFDQRTTSDNLLEEVWLNSFFRYGISGWDNILFAFAPAFFPDMFFYFFSSLFLENPMDKAYLTTLGQIACYLFGIFYVLNKSGVKRNILIGEVVFILVGVFCIVVYSHSVNVMYYKTDDNFGSVILTLFSLGLVLEYLNTKKTISLLLLAIMSFVGIISNNLFLVTFTAPMTLLVLYQSFFAENKEVWLKVLFIIVVGALVSKFIFEPLILPNATVNTKVRTLTGGTFKAWNEFYTATKNLMLSKDGFFYFFLALFVSATVFNLITYCKELIEKKRFLNRDDTQKWPYSVSILLQYGLLLTLANLSAPIVLGSFSGGAWGYRYFVTTITVNLIVALVLVFYLKRTFFLNKYIQNTVAFIMAGFLVFFLTHFENFKFSSPTRTIKEMREEPFKWSPEAALAKCLDDNKEKYNLSSGVSDFWTSYPISIYSKKDIDVLPVLNNFRPSVNLDRRLFSQKFRSGNPTHFNFLIISNVEQYAFSEESLLNKIDFFPDQTFKCPQPDMKVLVFTGDRFDKFVKSIAQKEINYKTWENKIINFSPIDWNIINTGRIQEGVLSAEENNDKVGYLNVGPHVIIPAGKYRVWATYRVTGVIPEKKAGQFELWLGNNVAYHSYLLVFDNKAHVEYEFENEKSTEFAIATIYFGKGKLELVDSGLEKKEN